MKASYCHLCKSEKLDLVLSLTPTPPANALVSDPTIEQERYPLDLYKCNGCETYQLLDIVDKEELYTDYKYVSGTSPVFVRHFRNYASDLISNFDPSPNDLIVDIGSNDGTLLKQFQSFRMRILGVDPAKEIARKATESGVPTIPVFFNQEVAAKILAEHGKAKIISCNNCFAHTPNLDDIIEGIKLLLADDGVFSVEVQYFPDMIKNNYFDMIYSEHIFYWTATAFENYMNKHQLFIMGAKSINTHGGSVRFYVGHKDKLINKNHHILKDWERGNLYITTLEERIGKFKYNIKKAKKEFNNCIKALKKEGKSVVGYGSPAKFTTLAYHFGVTADTIDYVIDDSPWKQGLYTSGLHIPIVSSDKLFVEQPDFCVIFAWNFSDSIIANCRKKGYKGKFIVPLPELQVIDGIN